MADLNKASISIKPDDVVVLEKAIDYMQSMLEPLRNFILPSGNEEISLCHVCRTITRRAERRIVGLSNQAEIDIILLNYINRLSDYFFVLSRMVARENNIKEIIWKP